MKLSKLLAVALIGTIGLTSSALAAGTTAGTEITNQPTLEYKFGGVEKKTLADKFTYVVDKVINFKLTRVDDIKRKVVPGTADLAPYIIDNIGNSAENFSIAEYRSGFAFKTFNVYVDENGNGSLDEGEKKNIKTLAKLAQDSKKKIWVQGEVDGAIAHGSTSSRGLRVRAVDSSGKLYVASSKNDMSKMDIIFADISRNNLEDLYYQYTATEDANLSTLTTTLSYSNVEYDPINKRSYAKSIPGAIVFKQWKIHNNSKTLTSDVLKFKVKIDSKIEKFAESRANTRYGTSLSYGKGVNWVYTNVLGHIKDKGVSISGDTITFEVPSLKPGNYAYVYLFTEVK